MKIKNFLFALAFSLIGAQLLIAYPTIQTKDHLSPQEGKPQMHTQTQRTLSIIKPDAVQKSHIGEIISKFEKSGLRIAAIKMTKLTPEEASLFYNVHKGRPFYEGLVKFMSSGPIVVMVLEGDDAIDKNRKIMGTTDPKNAEKGTIRADFAEDTQRNAVHGSDSPESAQEEINFFFNPQEIK